MMAFKYHKLCAQQLTIKKKIKKLKKKLFTLHVSLKIHGKAQILCLATMRPKVSYGLV